MDAFTGKEQNRANVVPILCFWKKLLVLEKPARREEECCIPDGADAGDGR